MGRAGYNERKLEILELVEAGFETSDVIADACGISLSCASSLLYRYWRWGLLSRYTASLFNQKVYSISDKGEERLDWLRSELDDDDGEYGESRISELLADIERRRVRIR